VGLPEEAGAEAVPIKEGDTLALPLGVARGASTDLVVLFLGDSPSMLTGFTTDFLGRTWDLDVQRITTADIEKLFRSKSLHSEIFFAPVPIRPSMHPAASNRRWWS
jgi:hypothetical protein